MHRDAVVVLIETGQGVTPPNVRLVFAGPFGKHLNEPPLLNGDHEQLGVRHRRKLQREAREHRVRSGFWWFCRPGERAVQTSVIKDPGRLPHDAVDPRLRVGAGRRIQYHRPDPGQSQFAGQHQPIGASPRDDDVNHGDSLSAADDGDNA